MSYLDKVRDKRLFATKSMNANWNHYYGVVKKITSLSGQWPYQKPITRLLCVLLVTLSTISMIIPQVAKFFKCDGNLQCIFETMTSYMLTSVTLVKLYTCYFNRCKMKVLIDQLFVDWNELETPEEYEIMKRYAKNGRRYSLVYALYCFMAVYIFMSVSLIPQVLDVLLPLNESRPILPTYPGYYFVDERKYFFYTFSHAIMAWEIAMSGIVSHDCILLTYIEHVCSIFTLVGLRFERLMCKRNNTMNVLHSHTSDVYRKQIAFSVYTHRKALKFAQLIEDTFSLTLAIQIALNTIMISITLLQITQQNADILEVIRYVMYVVGQLIHLFCLSFEGQKLIDHSLQTRDKIYNSLWYETSPKTQRILLFVMQKSLQPIFLSAGKIYIFSMENFTMIVQTSMSYFTVLSSLE
ncbi:odorant receptor 13a-like isoform X1 [Solenopsis invicta]|uniref:odorant receptor 13a-like isoform X1 n=1 Tax=Solenopsis invicta TaxID=13686 RepID=UPI00193D1403|nr:odorant receptor 13a-like isoform X1 [Solenopsis invicta]